MHPFRKHKALTGMVALLAAGGGASVALASGSSGTAAPGSGSLVVTVTGPNGQTHVRPVRSIRCSVVGGTYVLRAARAGRARLVSERLMVPGYAGAGSYTARLDVVVRGPFTRLRGERQVPVTLSGTGGSLTVTRTLPGRVYAQLAGKTVTLTANWTCAP